MITKEDYKLGVELQRKATNIFNNDNLQNFIKNYVSYLDEIGSVNLVTYYYIEDIEYCDDEIIVRINEGEYGINVIDIPIEYFWMNSDEWKHIEKEKYEKKVAEEERAKIEHREKYEKELLQQLKTKYKSK